MSGTAANILVGIFDSYIAPVGEALPEMDDTDTGVLTFAGNWKDLGYTEGGVSLGLSQKFFEKRVDQHKGVLEKISTEETCKLIINMAESDFDHFNYAISSLTKTSVAAGADQAGQDIVGFGDGDDKTYKAAFYGTSPEGYYRVYEFHIISAEECDKVGYVKDGIQMLKVTYDVLCDPTQSAGYRLFKGYDMTAVPTS